MQHSDKPGKELDLARELLGEMKKAKSLSVLETLWKRFLHHIDRVWNKAEAHYSKSPKWPNWGGKYIRLRRRDELLSYLVAARNADEHSISEITALKGGSFGINARDPSQGLHIKSLKFGPDGIKDISLGTEAIIEFTPAKVQLIKVHNRGQDYTPPTKHLGQPVDSGDLIVVATAALRFYESFLRAAEVQFLSPPVDS